MAVNFDVILGVVVVVVDAGFSRHVHIAPTADEANALTLLSCEILGSTARAVTSERFSFTAAGVTVVVIVAVAVAVFFSRALLHLACTYTLWWHSMPIFPAMKRLTVCVFVSVSVVVGVSVFVNVVVDVSVVTLGET